MRYHCCPSSCVCYTGPYEACVISLYLHDTSQEMPKMQH
jgi:hypothetical protein